MNSKTIPLILLSFLLFACLSCEDGSSGNGLKINYEIADNEGELIKEIKDFISSKSQDISKLAEMLNLGNAEDLLNSRSFNYTSTDIHGNAVTLSARMTYPAGIRNSASRKVSSILLAMPQDIPDGYLPDGGSLIGLRSALYNSLVVIPDGQGYGVSSDKPEVTDPILSARQCLDALDKAVALAKEDLGISFAGDCSTSVIGFGRKAPTACASAMAIENGLYQFRNSVIKGFSSVICAQTEFAFSNAEFSNFTNALETWRVGTELYFCHITDDTVAPYSKVLDFISSITKIPGNASRIHKISVIMETEDVDAPTMNRRALSFWMIRSLANSDMVAFK